MGLRGISVLAALLAMGQPALATTLPCTETARAGVEWDNATSSWSERKFDLRQYVVKEVVADRGLCPLGMNGKPIVAAEYPDPSYAFYSIVEVGKEAQLTDSGPCEIHSNRDGDLTFIECVFGRVRFEPDAGFWKSEKVDQVDFSHQPSWGFGSATIAVGKCPVIEP